MNNECLRFILPSGGCAALVGLTLLLGMSTSRAEKVEKIIFIGDSITRHAPNVEKLGWHGYYGMAASSEHNDYVHRFVSRLAQAQGSEPTVEVFAGGGGRLANQLELLDDFRQANAQVAVVQMGENDKLEVNDTAFQRDYERILQAIRSGNPNCRIFCFGVWTPPAGSREKDRRIREACEMYGATFVSLSSANADPRNKALSEGRFTHPGVNWHPGDRGMQAMADALWSAYLGQDTEEAELKNHAIEWSFQENWSNPAANGWDPCPPVTEGRARLENTSPGSSVQYLLDLPVNKIKGQYLVLRTWVRAENVSKKPERWNGIKLSLRLQNAEGDMSYPQFHLPTGTFEHEDVAWGLIIPDNIVRAQLMIGLENVTGTAHIDCIDISVQPIE